MAASPSAVRIEGRLDAELSRWLWLVKWLLAIPHFIVLAFLWIAFVVLSVVAFFAILFTARYPKGIFEFNVGVLRWTWRVAFYSYGALGTDRYPPLTLGVLLGGGGFAWEEGWDRGGDDWGWGGGPGLIGLLVLFAGVALLFTTRYPRGIFDFVLGLDRWVARVVAYAGLMTDAYPPFRLDQGGEEKELGARGVEVPTAPSPESEQVETAP